MPNSLARVFDLIARLRGADGCPWDRAQTLDDVLSDLIEEAYELEWAGTHHGDADIFDEMGDVLVNGGHGREAQGSPDLLETRGVAVGVDESANDLEDLMLPPRQRHVAPPSGA